MQFREIAEFIGVSSYPEVFNAVYQTLDHALTNFCDIQQIRAYEEKYCIAGDYIYATAGVFRM